MLKEGMVHLGVSVGGKINGVRPGRDAIGRTCNLITDVRLDELSITDNPANRLIESETPDNGAYITALAKSVGNTMLTQKQQPYIYLNGIAYTAHPSEEHGIVLRKAGRRRAPSPGQLGLFGGHNEGDTKVEDGVTYRLNSNSRWERMDKPKASGKPSGGKKKAEKPAIVPVVEAEKEEPSISKQKPAMNKWDPAKHILIAADSIKKLRETDVYRLFEEAEPENWNKLKDYIAQKRPELEQEAIESIQDLREELGIPDEPASQDPEPTVGEMLEQQQAAIANEPMPEGEAMEGVSETAFWLQDGNFDRARFEDFGISEDATELEFRANEEYRRLMRQYGTSEEARRNLGTLKKQMFALVKRNGGMGIKRQASDPPAPKPPQYAPDTGKDVEPGSIGFWLLNRNFDRAKFEDFGISEEMLSSQEMAEQKYKQLAKQFHPDTGGSEEQMQNINALRKQMMSFVKLSGGMKKKTPEPKAIADEPMPEEYSEAGITPSEYKTIQKYEARRDKFVSDHLKHLNSSKPEYLEEKQYLERLFLDKELAREEKKKGFSWDKWERTHPPTDRVARRHWLGKLEGEVYEKQKKRRSLNKTGLPMTIDNFLRKALGNPGREFGSGSWRDTGIPAMGRKVDAKSPQPKGGKKVQMDESGSAHAGKGIGGKQPKAHRPYSSGGMPPTDVFGITITQLTRNLAKACYMDKDAWGSPETVSFLTDSARAIAGMTDTPTDPMVNFVRFLQYCTRFAQELPFMNDYQAAGTVKAMNADLTKALDEFVEKMPEELKGKPLRPAGSPGVVGIDVQFPQQYVIYS
jgi:hypothetical protein